MPIEDYFIYRKLLLTFKIFKGMIPPEYMNVFFLYVNQVISRETRNSVSGLLYVPTSMTEYYKLSFSISTAIFMESTARLCSNM